jgi:hypothetical protein
MRREESVDVWHSVLMITLGGVSECAKYGSKSLCLDSL